MCLYIATSTPFELLQFLNFANEMGAVTGSPGQPQERYIPPVRSFNQVQQFLPRSAPIWLVSRIAYRKGGVE